MVLDFKSTLAFALFTLYIMTLKLVDARFYCFILTLIKGLRSFQKYQIIVSLSKAQTRSNSTEIKLC